MSLKNKVQKLRNKIGESVSGKKSTYANVYQQFNPNYGGMPAATMPAQDYAQVLAQQYASQYNLVQIENKLQQLRDELAQLQTAEQQYPKLYQQFQSRRVQIEQEMMQLEGEKNQYRQVVVPPAQNYQPSGFEGGYNNTYQEQKNGRDITFADRRSGKEKGTIDPVRVATKLGVDCVKVIGGELASIYSAKEIQPSKSKGHNRLFGLARDFCKNVARFGFAEEGLDMHKVNKTTKHAYNATSAQVEDDFLQQNLNGPRF